MWPYLLLLHRFGAHVGAILRGGAQHLLWIWLEFLSRFQFPSGGDPTFGNLDFVSSAALAAIGFDFPKQAGCRQCAQRHGPLLSQAAWVSSRRWSCLVWPYCLSDVGLEYLLAPVLAFSAELVLTAPASQVPSRGNATWGSQVAHGHGQAVATWLWASAVLSSGPTWGRSCVVVPTNCHESGSNFYANFSFQVRVLSLRETWGAGHLWANWLWWPYGSEGLPGRECHQLDFRDWRMLRGDRSSDPFRAKTWISSFPNGAASIFGCIRCSCQSGESRIRRFSPHLFTTRQTGISRAALRASALPRGIRCSSWSRQSRFRRFSPDLFPVRRITNSSQFCGQQLCRASDTMAACRNPHRPAGTLDGALRLSRKTWPVSKSTRPLVFGQCCSRHDASERTF